MAPEFGTLFKIKKYAIHDGPGIRTTLFLKGCPLSCLWCHNPEGIQRQPQVMKGIGTSKDCDEVVGWEVSVAEALSEIEKDMIFYDESGGGVTFSGGEPLMQAPFLAVLLDACRDKEVHSVVDTSGFAQAEVFEEIMCRVDMMLFDLKIMDDERHRCYTGVSNANIIENLKSLSASGTPFRIRFPVIPGITDDDENVRSLAQFAVSLGSASGIDMLPMHRIADEKYRRLGMKNRMEPVPPLSTVDVESVKIRLESYGLPVKVGG